MDTAVYEKLLSELGIPSEWSVENKESVLDEKYSEALELLDVAQQNGEENRIAQLDDRIKNIGEALEYTKEMKKRLSSGLVLNTQSDKDRLEELKEMGKKEETQTVKQLENTSQPAANTPVPQQPVSSNNANPLLQSQMRRAKMELEDENWRLAAQLYNDILNAEPENAEANLGLFMANQHIRKKNDIPEAARDDMKNNLDIFQDKQYQRTLRYADDSLRKELESYEKGRDYLIAIEEYQRAKTIEDYQKVSEMFDKLGDFADARKQKKECDGYWQKQLYDKTIQAMERARHKIEFLEIVNNLDKLGDYKDTGERRKQAAYLLAKCYMVDARAMKDVSQFSDAKEIFEKLGDYSDSKDKIEECEAGIKQLQEQQEAYGKYQQEYKNFEKQVVELQEIKQHESRIASQQARIDSLEKKAARSPRPPKRWILLMGVFGLLFYFVSDVVKWPIVKALVSTGSYIWNYTFFFDLLDNVYCALEEWFYYYKLEACIMVVILVIIFGCWVHHHMETEDAPAFIKSFFKTVLTSFIISLIAHLCAYVDAKFGKQAHLIGAVALMIAIAMIVKRIMGNMIAKSEAKEIKRLKRSIDDDYEGIEKTIGMEYQKIYDKYSDAGSERKAVSEVQVLLMDNIKKRHGAG